MRTLMLSILTFAILAGGVTAQQPPRAPAREIVNVKGDIYRARNNNYFSLFMVTPEGIILADPINAAFATWMKEQFAERFKVPVKYVIYSHSHWDHIEGGAVFADTARFIAQENVARNMDGRIPQMPGDMLDRNHNGKFELEEIVGPLNDNGGRCGMPANFFRTADRNGDGELTPAELQTDIRRPDIFYSDQLRLTLGGKSVDLIYPGKNHSDDATVMLFRDERVLFATEFLADALVTTNPHSLPSTCSAFDRHPLSEWIRSYRTVEALDFDRVAPGHGDVFDKAVVTETREYFEYLVAQVSAGIRSGRPLAELKETITLDRYKGWANYERLRRMNVEAAYLNLTNQ